MLNGRRLRNLLCIINYLVIPKKNRGANLRLYFF
jgi:hypothetical protein